MSGKPRHGMYNTPEHRAWGHMKDRCNNPKSQRYDRYGARGIRVCDKWMTSFEAFFADLGPRPSREHSLERLDNDGHYEPGNVVWATRDRQNNNKSTSKFIEFNGRRLTVAQWSQETGIPMRTLGSRLEAGWSEEDAITTPVESRPWNDGVKTAGMRISRKNHNRMDMYAEGAK
jgi:hypothetical protein